MLTKREFYINGEWVAPKVARDCPVIDPSTEEVCATISLGDQADTDAQQRQHGIRHAADSKLERRTIRHQPRHVLGNSLRPTC